MALKDRVVNIAYTLKDKFTGGVAKISSGFKNIENASDKSSKITENNNKRIEKSFFSLKKTALGVGSAITGAFVAASGALLGVFKSTATFQSLNASLKTVTGSAEAGAEAFDLISEFSKKTPFQLEEVASAFIKLKALGLDPSEASLASYGNTASALGKSLDQMIEAVADAATGEFERLKEFGIKAKQQGEQVSFTFQGVTTTVKKNAAEIEGYLRGIGETQFAGAMAEQMNTLNGQLSNLKDSFFRLAVDIGKAGAGDATGSIMSEISSLVEQASVLVKSSGAEITQGFNSIVGSARFLGNGFIVVFNGIQIIMRGLVRAAFGFAADINSALSVITFGDTSKEFKANADAMRETMADLEKDISSDVESAKNAVDRMGISFDKPIKGAEKLAKSTKELTLEIEETTKATDSAVISSNNLTKTQKKQLDSAAKRVYDKTRTDLEKLNAEKAEYKKLLDAGKISQDTFNRALNQTNDLINQKKDGGLNKNGKAEELSLSKQAEIREQNWKIEKQQILEKQKLLDSKNPYINPEITPALNLPTQEQLDNELREKAKDLLISLGVEFDQNKLIESINTAREQAQAQVKPIEIPVIYVNKNGNSFSDTQFDDAALTGGTR